MRVVPTEGGEGEDYIASFQMSNGSTRFAAALFRWRALETPRMRYGGCCWARQRPDRNHSAGGQRGRFPCRCRPALGGSDSCRCYCSGRGYCFRCPGCARSCRARTVSAATDDVRHSPD